MRSLFSLGRTTTYLWREPKFYFSDAAKKIPNEWEISD